MHLIGERIYTVDGQGDVMPRQGQIGLDIIDSAELFEQPPHIMHVTGLQSADFAVFFELEASRHEDESHGYLVTSVDESGEGILVLGDVLEADPQTWMSDRLANVMLLLGEEQMSEFNLSSLYQAVLARKKAA